MSFTDILYSLGWQTVRPLLWIAGRFSHKLAHAVALTRGDDLLGAPEVSAMICRYVSHRQIVLDGVPTSVTYHDATQPAVPSALTRNQSPHVSRIESLVPCGSVRMMA